MVPALQNECAASHWTTYYRVQMIYHMLHTFIPETGSHYVALAGSELGM